MLIMAAPLYSLADTGTEISVSQLVCRNAQVCRQILLCVLSNHLMSDTVYKLCHFYHHFCPSITLWCPAKLFYKISVP
jgi:hypothetical protein